MTAGTNRISNNSTTHTVSQETSLSQKRKLILPIVIFATFCGSVYFARAGIKHAGQGVVRQYENLNQYLVSHPIANDLFRMVIIPSTIPLRKLASTILLRSILRVGTYYLPIVKEMERKILRKFGCEYEENIADADLTRTDRDATRDLTLRASRNQLSHPEKRVEIEEKILTGLACHTKPNVLLVGPPGSGKSAIVESLANTLAKEPQSHPRLQECIWRSVKLEDFAGDHDYTTAQKIQSFLNSHNTSSSIILVFDEFDCGNPQNVLGTTLRNMLKPQLARTNLRILGCLTNEEYQRLQETDPPFLRRFTVVNVSEPSGSTLMRILNLHVQVYAKHHNCLYDPNSIQAAIDVTKNQAGSFPDKTLSLLDRAGAAARMHASKNKSTGLPRVTVADVLMTFLT